MSDYFRRRKELILLGYGMAALTKPLFPLATSAETVFIARFLDRVGKGIRGAPRDALVADVASPAIRGACFGLRQSMDTVGAFLGPLVAILMMYWFANDIRQVLWFAEEAQRAQRGEWNKQKQHLRKRSYKGRGHSHPLSQCQGATKKLLPRKIPAE